MGLGGRVLSKPPSSVTRSQVVKAVRSEGRLPSAWTRWLRIALPSLPASRAAVGVDRPPDSQALMSADDWRAPWMANSAAAMSVVAARPATCTPRLVGRRPPTGLPWETRKG